MAFISQAFFVGPAVRLRFYCPDSGLGGMRLPHHIFTVCTYAFDAFYGRVMKGVTDYPIGVETQVILCLAPQ